ncbi:MAG: hypothetical protein LBC74_14425 [Planctomycetaceae bacterium]|nr:hypothetical protein [Planctomycetaceae bacterium]
MTFSLTCRRPPLTPPKEGNYSPHSETSPYSHPSETSPYSHPSEASPYSPPSEASSYSPPSEGLGVVSEELKAVFCCSFFVVLMYF